MSLKTWLAGLIGASAITSCAPPEEHTEQEKTAPFIPIENVSRSIDRHMASVGLHNLKSADPVDIAKKHLSASAETEISSDETSDRIDRIREVLQDKMAGRDSYPCVGKRIDLGIPSDNKELPTPPPGRIEAAAPSLQVQLPTLDKLNLIGNASSGKEKKEDNSVSSDEFIDIQQHDIQQHEKKLKKAFSLPHHFGSR